MAAGRFFLGRSRGAAACSPPRSRSRSTACPPLSFWAAVVAGGSGARGGRWLFRSSLVPCGSGDVLALLGSLVCSVALVVLRAWRPCPALRGMCAHAACPGGVPHARSTTSAAFACACLIWRCAFLCLFLWTWRCCAFRSGWGQDVREGLGARTFSLFCAQMLYSCIPTHLMRSAGLIVLVRAFFAALQPHPRVSGAVGGSRSLVVRAFPAVHQPRPRVSGGVAGDRSRVGTSQRCTRLVAPGLMAQASN